MNLIEMFDQQKEALNHADSIVANAEKAGRGLTANESSDYNTAMARYKDMSSLIAAKKQVNTLHTEINATGGFAAFAAGATAKPGAQNPLSAAEQANPDYAKALRAYLQSGGKNASAELATGFDGVGGFRIPGSEAFTRQRGVSAAMYEGTQGNSDGSGGYAINVPTVQQIVPLALPDLGLYDASTVIPTDTDIKVPQQASFGTSAIKAESNGTIATFGGTDPTLQQTLLSAFMVGAVRVVSWELLADVQMFQQFIVEDLLKGQRITEGALLANGTGTGQPQGIYGHTGTGTGAAYALTGTAATDAPVLIDSLFDVAATLKGAYQPNASWIMSRASALAIRRAQMQANLFVPVVTTGTNGDLFILDKPVYFESNAPALPSATTAGTPSILFGDFKAGNMIGVRGGAGINVKILDQPLATQGQLAILAYRRIDSRIRRSEAIQQISFSHA